MKQALVALLITLTLVLAGCAAFTPGYEVGPDGSLVAVPSPVNQGLEAARETLDTGPADGFPYAPFINAAIALVVGVGAGVAAYKSKESRRGK